MHLEIEDIGLVSYSEVLEKQLKYVDEVAKGIRKNTLILCSHPPVVTLGRSSVPEDLIGWQGEVHSISRGGKATYHGPEQIIAYPILSLKDRDLPFAQKDVYAYLRFLEEVIIRVLAQYEISVTPHESVKRSDSDGKLTLTGVWVGEKKMASLGVAVRRWVTYHGVALNINKDPLAFQGIKACGFSSQTMTSLQEVLGQKLNYREVSTVLSKCFY